MYLLSAKTVQIPLAFVRSKSKHIQKMLLLSGSGVIRGFVLVEKVTCRRKFQISGD